MIEIKINCHSSIKLIGSKVIYIDPYKIEKNYNDADIIFITHDHYDHFSEEDIVKVIKENTIIVAPITIKLLSKMKNTVGVEPNKEYEIDGINIKTIPAYNIGKPFHPKSNNWVGYIIELENKKYYIAGDTDITDENKKVVCDVAFLPVGGTYTMNSKEAAELANIIKPDVVIPIHYGSVVGKKKDASEFKKLVNKEIKCDILIK